MQKYNEAERLFLEEVREKKKTASGVHHKTGKRGYVGKMLFPSDIMSRKEKYNHRKAGKVVTTNLYEEILPVDEFKKLDEFEQRNRLAYLRTKHQNTAIMKEMGMNNANYYQLVAELGLTTQRKNTAKRKATAKKAIAIEALPAPTPIETATPIEAPAPIQELIIDGLHLVYNGTFSPDQIVKQMLKFAALLEDEDDDFHIELKLLQKPKKEN
ncbi:hypothetical protein J7E63_15650 [Bacillus sp. ISL-75]|uniref:hypothetical protein n=1 Tax=Bacillus sp. ISL-75 TaxID=2819137 RepID=UPI001BEB7916|nr:hypothetical protein [Bacillus sp. ISL-75]MBT2728365.1 hypothetical protein [Bacillus sp. ISL-75]